MTRFAFALLSLLLAAPVVAQQILTSPEPAASSLDQQLAGETNVPDLQAMLVEFRTQGNLSAEASVWKRLSQLRPHLGQYKYELAATYARQDEKSLAYTALLDLQAQGYAFDPRHDRRFTPVSTTPVWEHILNGLDANRQPFGEGGVVHTLPAEDLLLESLAWDPIRKQLLAGSAREGKVYRVDSSGKLTPLVIPSKENGLWAVFDIVVDDKRGVLWVASTAVPHFKDYNAETDLGRAGIFKFDLKSGKFLKSYLSPTVLGHSFFMSSLAVAPDGTVFAADGVNSAVYSVSDDKLRRLFHNPMLAAIRGLAVSGDGSVLYFADAERGIFGYHLASGQPFEVAVPKGLALGGIEGLYWWNGHLLAVQNGMEPRRVMRLRLTPDGRAIEEVQPLEANQPAMSMPTQGTMAGDELLLIANSQKFQYDRFGLPRERNKLEGARIYRVPTTLSEALVTPPMPGPIRPTAAPGNNN
jgi:hypothetical protein